MLAQINQRVMVDYMAYFNRQPKKTAILDRQDRETPSGMNLFDPNPCSDLRLEPETNFSSTAKINPNDGQDIAEIASLQANGEDYDVFSRLLQKLSARYGMTNGLDDLFILCPARIPGYGLTTKEWGWMLVDNLTEIKHSPLAFESLRIDPEIKSLIEALVQGHQSGDPDDFDDVITGKGKGLVMLLYG